jgi:hypothetical protein
VFSELRLYRVPRSSHTSRSENTPLNVSILETSVAFCGTVGRRAKVLGRLGWKAQPPSKSACSILSIAAVFKYRDASPALEPALIGPTGRRRSRKFVEGEGLEDPFGYSFLSCGRGHISFAPERFSETSDRRRVRLEA